jgi:hypothetical protein
MKFISYSLSVLLNNHNIHFPLEIEQTMPYSFFFLVQKRMKGAYILYKRGANTTMPTILCLILFVILNHSLTKKNTWSIIFEACKNFIGKTSMRLSEIALFKNILVLNII